MTESNDAPQACFRTVVAGVFTVAAYLIASYLMFGDGLTPVVLFAGLLAAPSSFLPVALVSWISGIVGFLSSIWIAQLLKKRGLAVLCFVPLIVFLCTLTTALIAGCTLEVWKTRAFEQFDAERKYVEPVFVAFRHILFSDNWQYVHGAALKNCTPYIWSYSSMSFVEIGPNTAVNVLPRDWVKECDIQIV